MFRSIVRPVRASRFSKTVNFPQNNSSSIPAKRHGFNFDKPPGRGCLAQPAAFSTSRTEPNVSSKIEQRQRGPRTRDVIACFQGRANPIPEIYFAQHTTGLIQSRGGLHLSENQPRSL